jgi:hypothetical protein
MNTTIENITLAQLQALATEAAQAGDTETVRDCELVEQAYIDADASDLPSAIDEVRGEAREAARRNRRRDPRRGGATGRELTVRLSPLTGNGRAACEQSSSTHQERCMDRIVEINGREYDVDHERGAAHQALMDAGEREARIYVRDEDGALRMTVSVLTDSGTISQRED